MNKTRVECPKPNRARKNRGESMIMVAVMLMVFVILGAAVLTAASSTTAAASARISERQAYYYARSMLDVLDESMRKGALGTAVRDKAMDDLVGQNVNILNFTEAEPLALTYTPSVAAAPLNEATFSDVTIKCRGRAESTTAETGAAITRASIRLRTVDMAFTVTYHEQSVTMRIQYRYTGHVEDYSATTKAGTWTQDWVVQQLG